MLTKHATIALWFKASFVLAALTVLTSSVAFSAPTTPPPDGVRVLAPGYIPSVCTDADAPYSSWGATSGVFWSEVTKTWMSAPYCYARWGYLSASASQVVTAGSTVTVTAVPDDGRMAGLVAVQGGMTWAYPGTLVSGCGTKDITCTVKVGDVDNPPTEWTWYQFHVSGPGRVFILPPSYAPRCQAEAPCLDTYTNAWSYVGVKPGKEEPAKVEGVVSYPDGKGVSGITVSLTGTESGGAKVEKTSSSGTDGKYSFTVNKGTYVVTASGEGDYLDLGTTKKENGGLLSAEPDGGGACAGTATNNVCRLAALDPGQTGRADFRYTLCAVSERRPNGKPLTHCPIVFVPGFLGSRIACEGGSKELWPGLPFPKWDEMLLQGDGATNVATNGACNATAQALTGEDGLVKLVGGVLDIYQSAVDFFYREAPGRWWAAPYDWRKSPVLGAARLSAVVQEALTATGAKYVVLYGHSMGGLVIREYLNSQANVDKVARVLTAGTPYWGAPKAHFSLLGGYTDTPAGGGLDHITWQKELQTLSRNLQGAFFLYPSRNLGSWLSVARTTSTLLAPFELQSEAGEDQWMRSLGANDGLLRTAREWHGVNDGFPFVDLDYAAVVGAGSPTTDQVKVRVGSIDDVVGNVVFGNGDGTVPLRSATQGASESGSPLGKAVPIHYACNVGHVALPGDSQVLSGAGDYLLVGADIKGLDNKCAYTGAALYVYDIKLGGGNLDVSVPGPAPKSLLAGQAAPTQQVPLQVAVNSGLIQVFPVGKTTVIVTNDQVPVRLTFKDDGIALQMQRVSSSGNGPLEGFRSVKAPLSISTFSGGAGPLVQVKGAVLKPTSVSKQRPKTVAKVQQQGGAWVVILKGKSPNGVKATYYRIGNGKLLQYRRALRLKRSQLDKLRVYSVDLYGNAEKPRRLGR
jgi:pimeloyl-ACP methyl ester carboxylesterase